MPPSLHWNWYYGQVYKTGHPRGENTHTKLWRLLGIQNKVQTVLYESLKGWILFFFFQTANNSWKKRKWLRESKSLSPWYRETCLWKMIFLNRWVVKTTSVALLLNIQKRWEKWTVFQNSTSHIWRCEEINISAIFSINVKYGFLNCLQLRNCR